MPKKSKTLCVDDLRHAEYYGMQGTFDELYQKSQNGEVFENLMAVSYTHLDVYKRQNSFFLSAFCKEQAVFPSDRQTHNTRAASVSHDTGRRVFF